MLTFEDWTRLNLGTRVWIMHGCFGRCWFWAAAAQPLSLMDDWPLNQFWSNWLGLKTSSTQSDRKSQVGHLPEWLACRTRLKTTSSLRWIPNRLSIDWMSRHVTLPSLSESIKMKAIRSSMVKGCFNEKKQLTFRMFWSVKIYRSVLHSDHQCSFWRPRPNWWQ